MSRLILCADDFAFSPAVSATIAELAGEGRLNATSCMTLMPNWAADSAMLQGLSPQIAIGLHLVLTEERPVTTMAGLAPSGTLPTIQTLERQANKAGLPLAEIAAEVEAQFDRFEQTMGRAPAFIDGHQHSHALPQIREVVLDIAARRAPGAWLRTNEDALPALLARPFRGKALASAWHSRGFRAAAARRGLTCNQGFAGHYDFRGDYAALFPAFLRQPGEAHLVMCHPGAGERAGDAIAAARAVEAQALRRLPLAQLAADRGLTFPT